MILVYLGEAIATMWVTTITIAIIQILRSRH